MIELVKKDFKQLGAAPCFIKRLEDKYIKEATDIQCKVIPRLTAGENIFFTSATGTGKTFAYLLPLLGKLIQEEDTCNDSDSQRTRGRQGAQGELRFIIIAPTLELCIQINSELEFLLEGTNLKSSLLIGSVSIDRQIETLKKTRPDIIVGNPNRLLVLAKKKIIRFNNLKALVLDEADRLVSDEMIDETNELCEIIKRETKKSGINPILAACSATMNKKCTEKLFVIYDKHNISFIDSEDNEILREKIEHWAIFSEKRRKDQTLRSLLAAISGNKSKKKKTSVKALVFTSRGDEAAFVLSRLQYHHVSSAGLFGKAGKRALPASERKASLDAFRSGEVNVLVSTDLAARGLDIPGITHIIALDVPNDSEVYIHRCGRTARAGKRGIMVTIGDETQMHLLAAMEKKLKIRVQPKELHYGQVVAPLPIEE